MDVVVAKRSRLLVLLAIIALGYWLILFICTHLPISPTPEGSPYWLDKLMHAAAFGVLAVLACAAGAAWIGPSWKLWAGVSLAVAAYGLLDEVSQGFVQQRNADLWDWLADVVGAALGTVVFVVVRGLVVARRSARR